MGIIDLVDLVSHKHPLLFGFFSQLLHLVQSLLHLQNIFLGLFIFVVVLVYRTHYDFLLLKQLLKVINSIKFLGVSFDQTILDLIQLFLTQICLLTDHSCTESLHPNKINNYNSAFITEYLNSSSIISFFQQHQPLPYHTIFF